MLILKKQTDDTIKNFTYERIAILSELKHKFVVQITTFAYFTTDKIANTIVKHNVHKRQYKPYIKIIM